jgi:hypothetical protein
MTKTEQRNMIRAVRDYLSNMTPDDARAFEMLAKRDRDDEDLDGLSIRRLEELRAKYVRTKSKEEVEALFRKLSSSSDKPPTDD